MTKCSWRVVTSGRYVPPVIQLCMCDGRDGSVQLGQQNLAMEGVNRCKKQKKVLFYFGYLQLRGTFSGTAERWLHVCSHICPGDDGWSSAPLCLCAVVRGEVIMLLLRPSERKGDRRGCADAAAERPNYWPPLHSWRSRSSSESGDNDDSSVLTGMRSPLKPRWKAA